MPTIIACQLGSFTVTLTGVMGTVTGTAYYSLLPGGIAVVMLPSLSGTSEVLDGYAGLSGIPAEIRPIRPQLIGLVGGVVDNGTNYPGGITFNTDGTADLSYRPTFASDLTASFTPAGTKAMVGETITYLLG